MSKIKEALNFLKDDLDKAVKQWRETEQFQSLLQRENKDLKQLLDLFDPEQDENDWTNEYNDQQRTPYIMLYKKRMAILKASRKEFLEEYNEDITDVDFMRLLELPYTEPKYVIESSIEELQDIKSLG